MTIRAIAFDIGGVLELTPPTGWVERWEARLQLEPGELDTRLLDVWSASSIGTISEAEVERQIAARLGLNQPQLEAFMADLWEEYLGTPNVALIDYFASLRPRYRTAIISNSGVGAREREQARYRFHELCDLIIYSHEVGLSKPDPRIFALACARLGVYPAELVFLDDVEGHLVAARELGIHGVLFQNTAQAIAEIAACLRAADTLALPVLKA